MGLHVGFPYKIIYFPPWRRMLGALWPHCRIPVHGVGGELPFAGCSGNILGMSHSQEQRKGSLGWDRLVFPNAFC